MKKYCVVIPAYNEELTIAEVVKNIYPIIKDIIVINDCSTDGTIKILEKLPVKIITNKTNIGYTKSLEKGFQFAFNIGFEYSISFDADGQHDPKDIYQVIKIIKDKNPDFVVGKRNHKNRLMEIFIGMYTKKKFKISDPFCGLKALKRDLYFKYGCLENRYTIATEIYLTSARNGFFFEEIKISSIKRDGKSRFGSSLKGEFLELKAFINILSI